MDILKKYRFAWIVLIIFILTTSMIIAKFINKKIYNEEVVIESISSRLSAEDPHGDYWEMNYEYLDGIRTRKIELRAGENIKINAEVEIEKGTLKLQFCNENKEVIGEILQSSDESFKYHSERDASYYIKIVANEAKGSFKVSWEKYGGEKPNPNSKPSTKIKPRPDKK